MPVGSFVFTGPATCVAVSFQFVPLVPAWAEEMPIQETVHFHASACLGEAPEAASALLYGGGRVWMKTWKLVRVGE